MTAWLLPQQRRGSRDGAFLLGEPGTGGVHALPWTSSCLGIELLHLEESHSAAVWHQPSSSSCTVWVAVQTSVDRLPAFLVICHAPWRVLISWLQAPLVEQLHWVCVVVSTEVPVSSASFDDHWASDSSWEALPAVALDFDATAQSASATCHHAIARVARGQRGLSVALGSPPSTAAYGASLISVVHLFGASFAPVRLFPSAPASTEGLIFVLVTAPLGSTSPLCRGDVQFVLRLSLSFKGSNDIFSFVVCGDFGVLVVGFRPFFHAKLRALNTCIGSSGTRASATVISIEPTSSGASQDLLDCTGEHLATFFEALLGALFLGLLRFLVWRLPGKFSPLGRLLRSSTAPAPLKIVLPLGKVGGSEPCLDWTPEPHKPRPRRKRGREDSQRCSFPSAWSLRSLLFGSLLYSLPLQVWAVPPGTPAAVEALRHLTARLPESLPDSARARFAGQLGSPIATSSVAFASPGGPYTTAAVAEHWPTPLSQPTFRPQTVDSAIAQRIAYPSTVHGNGDDDRLLGVSIYAPHYRTEIWAVHMPQDSSLEDLRASIHALLKDAFRGAMNRAAPLIPQLHNSCAQFVAYPSILDADGSLGVAVIFDLSRVGGAVFASVVARVLQETDLIPFVRSLTRADVEEYAFYIGSFVSPVAAGEHVTLTHGTVITVVPAHSGPPHDFAVTDLLRRDGPWSQIQHMPRSLHTPCLCVLSGKYRFVIRQDLHTGRTIPEALAVVLDRTVDSFTTCSSFDFEDLDVQGEACDRLIATAPIPPQRSLPEGLARRDVWIFCDYRPLGHKPRCHLTHVLRAHIPSLLALDGVYIPPGFHLNVQGGVQVGDEVVIGSKTTLLFQVEPVAEGSASDQPPDPPSSGDDDDDENEERRRPLSRTEAGDLTRPSASSIAAGTSGQGPSRSRSPVAGREVCSSANYGTVFGSPRIPTPPLQDVAIQLSTHEGVVPPQHLEAKQPDRPGDTSHPVGSAPETRLAHLDQLLQAPDFRDGPAFPVDADELVQRRVRARGDQEAPETDLLFFLYAPLRVPEVLLLPLRIPCTVQQALQAVAESRDEALSARYPEVIIADPQPDTAFASLLLAPAWAVHKTIVLFDCRCINGALFCLAVWPRLNRESLCATAGLSSGPDVQVFVQGMPWALGAWQLVDLATGSTVTFLRRGQAAPQRHILEDMLFDSDPWNAQTAVPAPRGQHYLLLTEGIPQLFTLEAEGRLGYRDLIAQQLQFLEQNMTLQGTRPRLDDVVHCGHHPYAVVVATEAICLLPVPPARLSPPKWILVLDLRDILLPFSWRFLACDTIPVQEILREFDPCRPDGFVVSVTGAPIEHWPSGPVFRIRTGQVLSVSFVADDLDDSSDPGHGQDGAIPSLDHASGSDSDTEMHEAPEDLHDRHNNAEGDHGVRRVHDEPHSPVSSFGPVTVTVGFGILVPGFSIERIMLEIEIPTTIAAVTALLQQTRNADVARDFPGLLPALIQPDPRWGLFLALPIWGSGHNTICIDMFATRQTVFAVPAPSVADRGLLLEHAGLPSAADFDVYVDSEELVLAHSVIELQSGSTICLVPPGDQRPWTMQLSAMLTTHLPWDASEPYPSEPDIDRYCLACADGLRVFPILPDRAHLYREDIAARLQCPSRLLQLVPANPKPNDVAFFGFLCRNVLAALDRSAMRADDRATFGLLDARRIYKGWLPLVATDGWLDVAALLEQLAADLPSGWHVSITNLVLEQMHVYLEEGAVLTVAAQRDQERGYTAAPAPPASHSTSSGGGFATGGDTGTATADPGAPSASSGTGQSTTGARSTAASFELRTAGLFSGQPFDFCTGTAPSPTKQSKGCTRLPECQAGRRLSRPAGPRRQQRTKPSEQAGMWILCVLLQAIRDGNTELTPSSFLHVGAVLIICLILFRTPTRVRGSPTLCFFPLLLASCAVLQSTPCAAMPGVTVQGEVPNCAAFVHCPVVDARTAALSRRPVPTPCRGPPPHNSVGTALAGTAFSVLDCLEGFACSGPTLLEHSIREMQGVPYFETVALIETLLEHLPNTGFAQILRTEPSQDQISHSGTSRHCQLASPLHLSEYLPSFCVHDVTTVTMKSAIEVKQVATVLGSSWQLPSALPAGLSLHPRTQAAISAHVARDHPLSQISRIDVYTDGSFNGSISSWAFAALASQRSGVFLLAWARGTVALQGEALSIGATEHSAVNGERSALFWAVAWLLSIDPQIQRVIHSDCLVAVGQTNGRYGSAAQAPITVACRSLAQVLETLGGFTTSSVQHIKGHAGHPYNELVDTLAGAIGVADSHVPEFLHPLCAWATQGTITWLWLTVAALRQPAIWPRSQGNTLFDPHGNSTIDVSALSSANFFGEQLSDTPEAHKDDQVMWFQARFVSINVQSLGEDDSSSLPNRVPFVREQLSYVGCIVAALQETRAKCTSTVVSATHVRFLSARDQKGCFGVELWFARTVPYAWQGQQPLFFEAEDFRVLSWTPRQLFVRFAKGPLRIVFAACHAPTADHPERDSWWKAWDTHWA